MPVITWLQESTGGLLTLCALAIAVLLLLIIRLKLEPFIALLMVGLGLGLAAGLDIYDLVGTALKGNESLLETGFGGILGHIAVIIGLGTVLGTVLERSGGADALASALLRVLGEKRAPLAMGLLGLIVGIPVFFDIGIFVLAPLVYVTAARGGRSLVVYAMPMLAGLSMTHAFLPPHPGPVALAGLLGVDLGYLIVVGLACGIPGFVAAGLVWSTWIAKRVHVEVPAEFARGTAETTSQDAPGPQSRAAGVTVTAPPAAPAPPAATLAPPSVGLVAAVIAVPLLLILGATFGTVALDPSSPALPWLTFFGNPAVALLLAVLLASYVLGVRRGTSVTELGRLSSESLRPVGMILLVVGAGAFFGKVIAVTGIGDALADTLAAWGLPLIALAYVISCGLRIAQGSATVAIVTTGGIVGPLATAGDYSQVQLALIAMAIAAGSIIASHVNDGGFWIIAKYFNMTVKQTLQTWTVLETVLSVVSFTVAAVLFLLV